MTYGLLKTFIIKIIKYVAYVRSFYNLLDELIKFLYEINEIKLYSLKYKQKFLLKN